MILKCDLVNDLGRRYGMSSSQRPQDKAVPAESVYKTANKIGGFVDSMPLYYGDFAYNKRVVLRRRYR